jgi:hypothetical protein
MSSNYFKELIIKTAETMQTGQWYWPEHWGTDQKLQFINEMLEWLEENEMYEQCRIFKNVKETL